MISAEGYEGLAYLLEPEARAISPEKETTSGVRDVRVFVSPHGSYRFIGYQRGVPVSALQITSRDGRHGTASNV